MTFTALYSVSQLVISLFNVLRRRHPIPIVPPVLTSCRLTTGLQCTQKYTSSLAIITIYSSGNYYTTNIIYAA